MTGSPARALTIAGSDSGGGAGIQADLKTFEAHGVYGTSVVTALTAQNTLGVLDVHVAPAAFVTAQLEAIVSDIGVDAAKTGMLATAEIVSVVATGVREQGLTRLVVDPVVVATSGDQLLDDDAVGTYLDELLPAALIATPNLAELALLTGRAVSEADAIVAAARALSVSGPGWVLVTAGDGTGPAADDLLTDGTHHRWVRGDRVDTVNTHGTGCTLSAALAANLSQGIDVPESVARAKDYVTGALRAGLRIGQGRGPVDHRWRDR